MIEVIRAIAAARGSVEELEKIRLEKLARRGGLVKSLLLISVEDVLQDQSNGQAYYNLACIYSLTSRPYHALEALKRAIGIDGKFREKAEKDPDFDPVRKNQPNLYAAVIG